MRLTRTVPPRETAITVGELRAQCRIDHLDEDPALQMVVDAVTDYLDGPAGILGRAIVTQTWLLEMEAWPERVILPLEPVAQVSVDWLNSAGITVPVASNLWSLDLAPGARSVLRWMPAFVPPQLGPWPDPVRITMVAGYGDAHAVPSGLKKAMLRLGEYWHLGQGAGGPGRADALPAQIDALLARWRVLL